MHNKYILLRHGETIYQAKKLKKVYSAIDNLHLSLTKKGKKVIEKSAKELKNKNIDMIFSSDFCRTKISAKIVSKELKLPVIFDKRLREIDMGIFKGKPMSDYESYFSSLYQKFSKKPLNGESRRDVKKRLRSFYNEMNKKYRNKTILVISHGDPIWLMNGIIKGFTEKKILTNISNEKFYPKVAGYLI